MTLSEVDARGQEALSYLLEAIRTEWTGEIRVHFHEGTAKKVRRTEHISINGEGLDRMEGTGYT